MRAIAHAALVGAARLTGRCVRAVMEARLRGIQYELQFHRSFNAYRERKGIPALNGDLRAGS